MRIDEKKKEGRGRGDLNLPRSIAGFYLFIEQICLVLCYALEAVHACVIRSAGSSTAPNQICDEVLRSADAVADRIDPETVVECRCVAGGEVVEAAVCRRSPLPVDTE